MNLASVVVIELLPSGIVRFLDDRNGAVLTSTRRTTELRRGYVPDAPFNNVLWFSWENSTKADVTFNAQLLEQIITPGPVIQSYTPIDDSGSAEEIAAAMEARLDEVYKYLTAYVFRGCCDDGTPIPEPYIVKTYAEWDVIRLAGELPEGLWICVTDIPSQPSASFALFCKSASEIGLGGFGTFLNADWQNVGDYSGVFAITGVAPGSNAGQWYSGMETTTIVYTNLVSGPFLPGMIILDTVTGATAVIISDDGIDTMTVVITSIGLTFDPTDSITSGTITADVVTVTTQSIFNGDVVIWNCLHYQVVDAASFAGTDPATNTTAYTLLPKATANTGYIQEVDQIEFDFPSDWLQYRADKRGNTYRYSQSIDVVFLLGYTGINDFQWGRDLVYACNIINGYVSIINIAGVFEKVFVNECGSIRNIEIDATSTLGVVTISEQGLLEFLTLQSSTLFSVVLIGLGAGFQNKTILSGGFCSGITVNTDLSYMESYSSLGSKRHEIGYSNFESSLDITGGGNIDIGTNAELVGIYNLTSSNATETITQFTNFPTAFPFTVRPVAGLIVTINFTSVGSLSANGQIVDGTSFIVLNGDNGDSATFETATIGGFNVVKLVEVIQNT